MGRIVAVWIVLSFVAVSRPVHADVSGRASVIDADTVEVRGTRIRLHGIDAPLRAYKYQPFPRRALVLFRARSTGGGVAKITAVTSSLAS